MLRLFTLFTPTVLALAIVGIWRLRRAARLTTSIVIGFLLGALTFILVFRNASFIHDYYLIYFAPAVALLSTIAILSAQKAKQFRRFIRPAVTALILIWPVITLVVLNFLYTGSTNDRLLRLADAINQYTAPQDIIISNLPNDGLAVELYAERKINWSVPPEAVVELEQSNHRHFYLYCGQQDGLDTLKLAEIVEILDSCWLAQIEE